MDDWHIIGGGAIGCLFAANLQRSGVRCSLVLRRSGPSRCNIEIDEATGQHSITVSATSASNPAPIRHLLVTTKAYDMESALLSVAHRLGRDSVVLILVNGMGLLELAATILPDVKLFAGTTTEGAYRSGTRQIRHAGSGITRIGSLAIGQEPAWFDAWRDFPLVCQWDPDIENALWHKLAINCAINPLTALHKVHNGALQQEPALMASVNSLCEEIAAVSKAAGFSETARRISGDAAEVIRRTADNKSSMLQDVLAGRRTEIDFITGYLVRRADALGVKVERNRDLLERIRQLGP